MQSPPAGPAHRMSVAVRKLVATLAVHVLASHRQWYAPNGLHASAKRRTSEPHQMAVTYFSYAKYTVGRLAARQLASSCELQCEASRLEAPRNWAKMKPIHGQGHCSHACTHKVLNLSSLQGMQALQQADLSGSELCIEEACNGA
jgi:hypothetical protein